MSYNSSVWDEKSHLELSENTQNNGLPIQNSFFDLGKDAVRFYKDKIIYQLDYLKDENGNEYRAEL